MEETGGNHICLCESKIILILKLKPIIFIEIYEENSSSINNYPIGQCAIVKNKDEYHFLDNILLSPGYKEYWSQCLEKILCEIGFGKYVLGSKWNINSFDDIYNINLKIAGVTEEKYSLDYIDLAEYESFDQYIKGISSSHRRNIKKARNIINELEFVRKYYIKAIPYIKQNVKLRKLTYDLKGMNFNYLRTFAATLIKTIQYPNYFSLIFVKYNKKYYSAIVLAEIGKNLYYLHGGNKRNKVGISHYLFSKVIEKAISEGKKKLFMGYGDLNSVSTHREFRLRFSAITVERKIMKFSYHP